MGYKTDCYSSCDYDAPGLASGILFIELVTTKIDAEEGERQEGEARRRGRDYLVSDERLLFSPSNQILFIIEGDQANWSSAYGGSVSRRPVWQSRCVRFSNKKQKEKEHGKRTKK